MPTIATMPGRRAAARLQAAGLRPTRQRIVLAQLLFDGGDRHFTAEQLHGDAGAAGARVSLATVYNTLHQFVAAGLLREITVEPGRSWFDTNTAGHHHFYHADRGELRDIPGPALGLTTLPEAPDGTVIERIDVIVRVRSAACPDAD
ncbi:MAG: iron response transcriptional regulator IrrA [Alphaproteobacteria bacterium]